MSDLDFRLFDLRWLLYRSYCRWQLGESDPRWVAVAVLASLEVGWATVIGFTFGPRIGWQPQELPTWAYWTVGAVLYLVNWWAIFPVQGLVEFEERFRRWPPWAQALETPLALLVSVGCVAAAALKVWTWF